MECYGVNYPEDVWMGVYPPFLGGALVFHQIFYTQGPQVEVVGLLGDGSQYWNGVLLPILLHPFAFPRTPSTRGPWIQSNALFLVRGKTEAGSVVQRHRQLYLGAGVVPNDPRLKGAVFSYQAMGILPDKKAPYGFYLVSTRGAKCRIGSGLSGWSGGFMFYSYHQGANREAWFYKPFGLVAALERKETSPGGRG